MVNFRFDEKNSCHERGRWKKMMRFYKESNLKLFGIPRYFYLLFFSHMMLSTLLILKICRKCVPFELRNDLTPRRVSVAKWLSVPARNAKV